MWTRLYWCVDPPLKWCLDSKKLKLSSHVFLHLYGLLCVRILRIFFQYCSQYTFGHAIFFSLFCLCCGDCFAPVVLFSWNGLVCALLLFISFWHFSVSETFCMKNDLETIHNVWNDRGNNKHFAWPGLKFAIKNVIVNLIQMNLRRSYGLAIDRSTF